MSGLSEELDLYTFSLEKERTYRRWTKGRNNRVYGS